MELGRRLNILRDQFGREQAASLEETYKQSREGEEEAGGAGAGDQPKVGGGDQPGGRDGDQPGGRDGDQPGGNKAVVEHQSDSQKDRDEIERETDFQEKKIGHINVPTTNLVPSEDEMDQGKAEYQSASDKDNHAVIIGSTSNADGENRNQVNKTQKNWIQNPPEISSEKNLQAADESQYPLPDTGSKANLDFVTLKAAPTFSRNTKYSKDAKNAWKRIISGNERKMPSGNSEQALLDSTNEVLAVDTEENNNDNNKNDNNNNSENIKFDLNKGENMLRSLGSSRNIRRKLPIRAT